MDESVTKLSDNLKEILKYLRSKKQSIKLGADNTFYIQRITKFKDRFHQYYEEITPKVHLGSLYSCTGRLKFYQDNKLYIYLEVSEKTTNSHGSAAVWPVKLTWKLEIVDQDKDDSFSLGEASCTFNKPRQGFVAHPNDWICVDYERIVHSGLIGRDGAATLRWTFVATPILQVDNVEEFQKILENLEIFCDHYEGPEIMLIHIQKSVDEILKKRNESVETVSRLENKLCDVDTKLDRIEKLQGNFQQKFDDFKHEAAPVIDFIKSRCKLNHTISSTTRTEV